MRPSKYREVRAHPELQRLLVGHVDMQLLEIWKMFRMGGFNFPLSAYLLDMISGTSVCFYNASKKNLVGHQGRCKRFKNLIKSFYPRESDLPISRRSLSDILWNFSRNPLAHSLGIDLPEKGARIVDVALSKRKFTSKEVYQLENCKSRPSVWPPTVRIVMGKKKTVYAVSIPTLYWG